MILSLHLLQQLLLCFYWADGVWVAKGFLQLLLSRLGSRLFLEGCVSLTVTISAERVWLRAFTNCVAIILLCKCVFSVVPSVHFPITIIICKHWSKFVTCSPSPRDCEGVSHPQRHSYYGFRLYWTKWLSQNFDPLTLGKNERGRGPRCPPIFWSLKTGTRTFNFR